MSDPLLPKPVPDQYRMKFDLRVQNTFIKPTAWPMHNLQDELHDLHGSRRVTRPAWVRIICDAGFLSRLLADTSAQTISRLKEAGTYWNAAYSESGRDCIHAGSMCSDCNVQSSERSSWNSLLCCSRTLTIFMCQSDLSSTLTSWASSLRDDG
jgi:hypothetical protein